MPLALSHEALYASFDRFPSRKGSAVHIDRFARALFAHADGGLLYVLGGDGLPPYQREAKVEIVRFSRPTDNYLERALAFSARLEALLDQDGGALRLAHIRDPWSGMAIVQRDHATGESRGARSSASPRSSSAAWTRPTPSWCPRR